MTARCLACLLHDLLCKEEHPEGCSFLRDDWSDPSRRVWLTAAKQVMARTPDVPWRRVGAEMGHV